MFVGDAGEAEEVDDEAVQRREKLCHAIARIAHGQRFNDVTSVLAWLLVSSAWGAGKTDEEIIEQMTVYVRRARAAIESDSN